MDETVPDRGVSLLAVNIAFLSVAVVAVALRCYTRIGVVRAFGLDDWVMLFAAVSLSVRKQQWRWYFSQTDRAFTPAIFYHFCCVFYFQRTLRPGKTQGRPVG